MEHFIRIAFWIVTLAGCLSAKPIQKGITEALKKEVHCTSELKLYAPEHVEKECFTKALDCFMKELRGPAKEDCKDPDEYINAPLEVLEKEIKDRLAHNNSTECALECESWPEVSFHKFLTNMDTVFQQINSEVASV